MPKPLQTVQINVPAGFIDLGLGDPAFSLLPLDLIRQAADQRLSQNDNRFLQYGAEQGDGYFRLALANFLTQGYGFPVEPERLFITTGISSALDLLCTLFTRPGDTVFVEEPSYFLALRIFADHGLRVVSIQTDEAGLVVEVLEEALEAHRPKFLYIIPTFQNPSGHTLTQERRERLVALSEERGFLVLADEVYHFLNYTIQPPRSFGAYVDSENIVSLGSFSKILAPGLRLGWLQAHSKIIQRLARCGLLDSGGGLNPFTSAIVRGLLESGGLEGNIAKLVAVYRRRMQFMDEALRRYLREAKYNAPQGGYFFWMQLPGVDTQELQQRAQTYQVGFRPGVRFSSRNGLHDFLRVGISFYDVKDIERGLMCLKQCLESG